MSSTAVREGRGAFGGYIGPRRLLEQVRQTAPYHFDRPAAVAASQRLWELGCAPAGWRLVLHHGERLVADPAPSAAAISDYFALCLACHFASVATFVPTDVDTKIRHHLWAAQPDPDELLHMVRLGLASERWDARQVSARVVQAGEDGWLSGHDGERLAVLAGGLLACLRRGLVAPAAELEEAIDAELRREARAFQRLAATPGAELQVLRLAVVLTHNAGDLDQGLAGRGTRGVGQAQRARFGRLAHQDPTRYDGAFARAALLYRQLLAKEGHRHYPLRELRALRTDPALLLPMGPFLDDWGATLARYPTWDAPARAEVVTGLVAACQRVPGQVGYFRALAGISQASGGALPSSALTPYLGAAARKALRDGELRRHVAVPRGSFESSLSKRARALLDGR